MNQRKMTVTLVHIIEVGKLKRIKGEIGKREETIQERRIAGRNVSALIEMIKKERIPEIDTRKRKIGSQGVTTIEITIESRHKIKKEKTEAEIMESKVLRRDTVSVKIKTAHGKVRGTSTKTVVDGKEMIVERDYVVLAKTVMRNL